MKFYGKVGFAEQQEVDQDVFKEVITEKTYCGDILHANRHTSSDDKVNSDFTVNNSISIVADAFAYEHIFAIRYVEWMGVKWSVTTVETKPPRLNIYLGGVYHDSKK